MATYSHSLSPSLVRPHSLRQRSFPLFPKLRNQHKRIIHPTPPLYNNNQLLGTACRLGLRAFSLSSLNPQECPHLWATTK
jgi:hypothetical protein